MHQFSLYTKNGTHIGFLVIQPDKDGSGTSAECGQIAVKVLSDCPDNALSRLARENVLYFENTNGIVQVFDVYGMPRADIRQQWLNTEGEHYEMGDLDGNW